MKPLLSRRLLGVVPSFFTLGLFFLPVESSLAQSLLPVTGTASSDPESSAKEPAPPTVETTGDAAAEQMRPADVTLEQQDTESRARWQRNSAASALPERADVLALTVSGGVSLGSHEAGMLHLLTEALRRSPGSAQLKVVTGASAGSANAVIAATDACQKVIEAPENSLGYRVWVLSGLDQLFDPARVSPRGLFVRDGLRAGYEKLQDTWRKGLPKQCDFAFGVAVTREKGYDVDLAPGLVVPRQAERFVVRVRGRDGSSSPIFWNYLDPSKSFERPLLPLSEGRDPKASGDMEAIWQLISASAAFPIAFSPQPVEHCTTPPRSLLRNNPENLPPSCPVATRVDAFIDGGVFDNNPLGTAYDLASNGLIKNGDNITFRPIPSGGNELAPEIVLGYVDPDLRNYTVHQPAEIQNDEGGDPILSNLARLGGNVLSSARGRELAAFAEDHPEALGRLWTLEASYPPISELLGAFFGFFEKDFRDFDFHLGSYDTFRDLRDNSGSMLGVEQFLKGVSQQLEGPIEKVPARYQKLSCILAHTEPDRYGRLAPLCEGEELHNFRVLLQVTIDRLWSNCRRLGELEISKEDHLQCKRARGGISPPQVDPSFKVKMKRYQQEDETSFDYSMRLMSDYHFYFKDLGLSPHESRMGRKAVRRELADMVQAFSNAQPGFGARTTVLTAGRALVNGIGYEPPPRRWVAMLGTSVSIGYLQQFSIAQPFFLNPEFRQQRFRELVLGEPTDFAATLSLGVEWAVLPFSGSILQSALALRGGYQFSGADKIGVERCDDQRSGGDPRSCSQFVIHLPLSVTVLERLRVSIMPIFYPVPQIDGHKIFDLEFGFGGEFF